MRQLEAVFEDGSGNQIGQAQVTWEVVDPNAGSVGPNGMFTAGELAGDYEGAIIATSPEFGLSATESINIVPGPLEQVGIAPGLAEIGIGMTQQFAAAGADEFGNRIAGLSFAWSIENGGGTIDRSGLFTGRSDPSTYDNTVRATVMTGEIERSGTVSVTVEPDRIAFLSNRDAEDIEGSSDVYMMNVDGTDVERVTRSGVNPPLSWSPDGRRFAYSKSGKIVVRSVGYQFARILYSEKLPGYSPSWSRDGARIAFYTYEHAKDARDRAGTEIYVMDIDGGNRARLTDNSYRDAGPSWSPDSAKIVFSGDPGGDSRDQIFVMDNDGANMRQLSGSGDNLYPKWSPDGNQIVLRYKAGPRDRPGIGVLGASSHFGVPRWLMNPPAGDNHPDWSPDGDKIVFESYRDSEFTRADTSAERRQGYEIYVVDRSGHNVTRLTNNDRYDGRPVWAPRKRGVEVSDASIIFPRSKTLRPKPMENVVTSVESAVVKIRTDRGSGSGFIFDPSGLVLTNNHVIRDVEEITVILANGTEYEGKVQGRDLVRDLAVVTIEANDIPSLELGRLDYLKFGQEVMIFGFPLGTSELSVTRGLVSAIQSDPGRNLRLIQTDSAINPGNSGGPMINRQGEVVGIVTSKIASVRVEGIGFAIAANTATMYLDRLKAGEVITN